MTPVKAGRADRLPATRGEAAAPEAPAARPAGKRRFGAGATRYFEAYALLGLLALTALFFSLLPATADTFPTEVNLQITVANQAVLAIVAIGVLLPLITNGFDLSVGAVTGLSAVFVAATLSAGTPIVLAVMLGVGLGVLVGTVNALLVSRVGLDAVVTTLGTATIVTGVVIQKTGGVSIVADIPQSLTHFAGSNTLRIPNVALVMAAIALAVWFLLEHTPYGRHLYALGSNPSAARLVGVRTTLVQATAFVLAGALCGAAGVLSVARAGGADPSAGAAFLLPALAAAFLSAASVKPGRYNVGGVLVAIFFLAVLNSGLNLAGAAPYVADYVNGGALIVGVALAVAMRRRRAV